MDRLQHVSIAALDRGRLTHQVDRHLDRDRLLEVDLVEVDVDGAHAARVGLDLAHEHLLGVITVHDQVDQVSASRLQEHLLELEAVQLEGCRLRVVPIDDGGELALAVKTARALAQEFACGGFELHGSAFFPTNSEASPRVRGGPEFFGMERRRYDTAIVPTNSEASQ
jgi:hypothetical protein